MIDLKPDTFRVQGRDRVVARRPTPFCRCSDYVRADALQKRMQLIDVFAATCPEAQMFKARTGLDVRVVGELRVGAPAPESGPAADVVDEPITAVDGLQPELWHHLVVERDAFLKPVHPQKDMGDTIDFHAARSPRSG